MVNVLMRTVLTKEMGSVTNVMQVLQLMRMESVDIVIQIVCKASIQDVNNVREAFMPI